MATAYMPLSQRLTHTRAAERCRQQVAEALKDQYPGLFACWVECQPDWEAPPALRRQLARHADPAEQDEPLQPLIPRTVEGLACAMGRPAAAIRRRVETFDRLISRVLDDPAICAALLDRDEETLIARQAVRLDVQPTRAGGVAARDSAAPLPWGGREQIPTVPGGYE